MSDMSVDQILSQMRTMRMQAQARLQTTEPALSQGLSPMTATGAAPAATQFADLLTRAVNGVNDLQNASSQLRQRFDEMDPNVDIAQVMVASQKASLGFTAVSQVRNRMVAAYQEVMSMSI